MVDSFAFTCGEHLLTGTYGEQKEEYAKIAELRRKMEDGGDFKGIEGGQDPEAITATEAWHRKMDLVWKEYNLRKT